MAIAKLTKKIARDSGVTRDGKPLLVILEPSANGEAQVVVKQHGVVKKHSISAGNLYDMLTVEASDPAEAPSLPEGDKLVARVLELLPTTPIGDDQKASYDVKVALTQILNRIASEASGHADATVPAQEETPAS